MKAEDWLAIGLTPKARLSFARILEQAFERDVLRAFASKHGTKPKGFRIEKASAAQLADAIAEDFVQKTGLREDIASALAKLSEEDAAPRAEDKNADAKTDALVEQLGLEVLQLRERLAKAEQSAQRAGRSREDALAARSEAEARVHELEQRVAAFERARRAEESAAQRAANAAQGEAAAEATLRALSAEVRELEEGDRKQRFRIAELTSRLRESENEASELLEFLPRGERERRKQLRRSYEAEERSASVLPRFDAEFFRNVDDLDISDRRKIYTAVAKLLLHGPEYPGLQLKALKGMDGLMSVRAADDLRIYLRREGDVVGFEACGHREDQAAFLKRRRS